MQNVVVSGLDIPAVSLVINHSIPSNATDYLHRVGRTARANKPGTAISLITPNNIARIRSIEEQLGKQFKEYIVSGTRILLIISAQLRLCRMVTIEID